MGHGDRPAGFGALSGNLLVGNFGDGHIHAYNPSTGKLVGTVRDENGKPLVIDGLWGLMPGDSASAATSDVWFSAARTTRRTVCWACCA